MVILFHRRLFNHARRSKLFRGEDVKDSEGFRIATESRQVWNPKSGPMGLASLMSWAG